jgi:hypothetical protein
MKNTFTSDSTDFASFSFPFHSFCNKDDTTYDTVFQTTKGDTLILRVNVPLTSSFAFMCPAMTLAGVRVSHPWVESERMRVTGYTPLQSEQNWQSSSLLLGAAVHEVVKHLQLNPPEILEITDMGLRSIQPSSSRHSMSKSPSRGSRGKKSKAPKRQNRHKNGGDAPPSYDVFANSTPAPDVPLPTIPKTYPVIEGMAREELEQILQDESNFLEMVQTLPIYSELRLIRGGKLEENVKIAEENLGKESQLKELNDEVAELQQKLKSQVQIFEDLEAKQNAVCAPPDLRQTLKKLNRAKKEAFEKSEEYAEEWVEAGAQSVNNFVKEFVEMRKIHHIRGAKMEILQNSKQNI